MQFIDGTYPTAILDPCESKMSTSTVMSPTSLLKVEKLKPPSKFINLEWSERRLEATGSQLQNETVNRAPTHDTEEVEQEQAKELHSPLII